MPESIKRDEHIQLADGRIAKASDAENIAYLRTYARYCTYVRNWAEYAAEEETPGVSPLTYEDWLRATLSRHSGCVQIA